MPERCIRPGYALRHPKTRTVLKSWLDEFTFSWGGGGGREVGRGSYYCIVMLSSIVEALVHAEAYNFVNNFFEISKFIRFPLGHNVL